MEDLIQYIIPYLVMPILGMYVAYEFIKMLILNYKDKNGKS
jgi:hypothetical protein